jgi:hypothetical protein
MTRETEIEYNRWRLFVDHAKKAGIDINDPKYTLMVKTIAVWGEALVALRLTQTPEQRSKAMQMAFGDYSHEHMKKELADDQIPNNNN